jgi:pyruvate dehydrogenase E2 component (dihydrolipoamide acetyltransferase)
LTQNYNCDQYEALETAAINAAATTVDFTRIVQRRQTLTPQPSFTSFVVRAVAVTLSRHPEVNVSYVGGGLLRHAHVNVGVAIATAEGLLVPVIRDADRLGVVETDLRLLELRQKAEKRHFKGDDLSGGTGALPHLCLDMPDGKPLRVARHHERQRRFKRSLPAANSYG